MNKLANEYRETMDSEFLHSWARDAVEEIRRLETENTKLRAVVDLLETQIDDLYAETVKFY